ncbi:C-type lectin-like domain containing protein [Cryptosporidium ryanae]|uniref:C-type lectin-like domain containing protein n=1 Tax=Cryptosporidium ryanae TaxID=515981 RepID=UPI00351A1B14|nr:C-type lectin-like domain containing protein [Cryptosporidium ryanae]
MKFLRIVFSNFFVLISLILSFFAHGRVYRQRDKVKQANCPNGWVSNKENTRCFKLLAFEKPKTFSHGFRSCNELESTEILTFGENGVIEKDRYPVTLATVYKKTDDEAIKKVLEINSKNTKTNGCFVGLRKYAFFKYPPGWYWVDSNQQLTIRESNIEWTSNYNANWLVKLKFPFEKCGFYDNGGLGKRPCWLIDSELSCAVCATVAYDSGGLNPNKYFELIKQTDDIISKEPKLDSQIYSNLNCSDPLAGTSSIILCQNVSSILNSTWNNYYNSLMYPESLISWKGNEEKQIIMAKDLSNNPNYSKKKTFVWDQDFDFNPALSDELKLESSSIQPKFYNIEYDHIDDSERDNLNELLVSNKDASYIEDIFFPVTKSIPDTSIQENNHGIKSFNGIKSISNFKDELSYEKTEENGKNDLQSANIKTSPSLEPLYSMRTFASNTATSTTTTAITTNKINYMETMQDFNSKNMLNADSSEQLHSIGLFETKNRVSTDNVRTNNFVKYNNINTQRSDISKSVINDGKDNDSSLLGFGAGESVKQLESNLENEIETETNKNELKKKAEISTEMSSYKNKSSKNWLLVFMIIIGIILFLLLLLCIIFSVTRKRGENVNLENNNVFLKSERGSELQLTSIQPIFGKKNSKLLPLNNQELNQETNLTKSERGVLSIEDTGFSPEYMNASNSMEESKSAPYFIAHSQANTLQLHSENGITVNYDTRIHVNRSNFIKSPKYHEFYYSEANKRSE